MYKLLFDSRLFDEVGEGGGAGGGAGEAQPTGGEGTSTSTEGGEAEGGGTKGALSGVTAEGEGEGESVGFDFEKGTADDYFTKVKVESIEGMEFSMDNAKKNWGAFLMENKISPEVFSKFLALEGKYQKEMADANARAEAKEAAKLEAKMAAEDEAFRKEFNPEQINAMVDAAKRDFGQDRDFLGTIGTTLSSNPSIGKLLLFWAEGHKADTVPNGGNVPSKQGFAARWTGNPKY